MIYRRRGRSLLSMSIAIGGTVAFFRVALLAELCTIKPRRPATP